MLTNCAERRLKPGDKIFRPARNKQHRKLAIKEWRMKGEDKEVAEKSK